MSNKKLENELTELKIDLDDVSRNMVDEFFNELNKRINLPFVAKEQLINDYLKAFRYYLNNNYKVKKIVKLLDLNNLGDFYAHNERRYLELDNAAIVYPLGMRQHEMPMFRLGVKLKEVVCPELLQIALDITIKRFPGFVCTVKSGFFWHYLETNNNPIQIEEEKDIPCKPISRLSRTYRSFRVLYYKKRISIEFFHVLTDGTGGLVFLKTLLREYFNLKGIKVTIEKGILDINGIVNEEELENEFKKAKGDSDFNTFVDHSSLQLKGKRINAPMSKIVHFILETDKLKEVSKKYSGTITAYICAIMFLAAKPCIKQKEGLFNIQIPINMRKFNNSKTLKNYSMYFNASVDIKNVHDKETLVKEISKQIKEKGSYESMHKMMVTTGKIINSLSFAPKFLKNIVLQLVYGSFANSMIGSTLSNVGLVDMPEEMKKEIDMVYFLLSPGYPNRASATMASINNKTLFTVIKNSDDDTFENNIYDLLKEDGLKVELEGSIDYES